MWCSHVSCNKFAGMSVEVPLHGLPVAVGVHIASIT